MSIWDKILGGGAKSILEPVAKILDETITSDEERQDAKTKLIKVITEFSSKMMEFQKDILTTEMKGNWLQRSWRPILMLLFGFIVIYEYFIAKVFNLPSSNLPDDFWALLKIGMGGYIIGRSVEKTAEKISDKINVIPGKKNK